MEDLPPEFSGFTSESFIGKSQVRVGEEASYEIPNITDIEKQKIALDIKD